MFPDIPLLLLFIAFILCMFTDGSILGKILLWALNIVLYRPSIDSIYLTSPHVLSCLRHFGSQSVRGRTELAAAAIRLSLRVLLEMSYTSTHDDAAIRP